MRSTCVVRVAKGTRLRWAGYVASIREKLLHIHFGGEKFWTTVK